MKPINSIHKVKTRKKKQLQAFQKFNYFNPEKLQQCAYKRLTLFSNDNIFKAINVICTITINVYTNKI